MLSIILSFCTFNITTPSSSISFDRKMPTLQQYYIPTARELALLVGIRSALILHHFAESLSGVATVRAFNQESRFIDTNLSLIDDYSRPLFHNISAMEWLSLRLNLLSNFVFSFSLVVVVSLPEGVIDPSKDF